MREVSVRMKGEMEGEKKGGGNVRVGGGRSGLGG